MLNPWRKYGWMLSSGYVKGVVYDDLECGVTSCYMFEPKETQLDDKWFINHKNHNDAIEEKVDEIIEEEYRWWE